MQRDQVSIRSSPSLGQRQVAMALLKRYHGKQSQRCQGEVLSFWQRGEVRSCWTLSTKTDYILDQTSDRSNQVNALYIQFRDKLNNKLIIQWQKIIYTDW